MCFPAILLPLPPSSDSSSNPSNVLYFKVVFQKENLTKLELGYCIEKVQCTPISFLVPPRQEYAYFASCSSIVHWFISFGRQSLLANRFSPSRTPPSSSPRCPTA